MALWWEVMAVDDYVQSVLMRSMAGNVMYFMGISFSFSAQ